MRGHFRAFSFVDRIASVEGALSVRGHYAIPTEVEVFPASLVSEAVGQLAAWAAMAAVDFSHRPVAGIAGKIELLSPVRPGQVLDLVVELESVDKEAVGYSGSAHAGGVPVIRLSDCVGPMLPVEDFDDPQLVRDRFHLLRADGLPPGGFGGLPLIGVDHYGGEWGDSTQAVLQVPMGAPFFDDHFPRRHVFPGTLLMHGNLQIAAILAAEVSSVAAEGAWVPRVVSDVKLRTFISPGEALDLKATRTGLSETELEVTVESRIGPRLIGSAKILFVREVSS